MRNALLLCAVLGMALPAGAQAPDPLRADARVPPPRYESVFENYQRYQEPELAPWRQINEDVEKAGGHIGIFRSESARPPEPAANARPAGKPAAEALKEHRHAF